MKVKNLIVGTGIAGITLAEQLDDCALVEKAKGIGGRFAARRLGPYTLEHGVPSFTHPETGALIDSPHRWIKSSFKNLNVSLNWEAQSFFFTQSNIVLTNQNHEAITCENLFLTCPAPQTQKLLALSGLESNFLGLVGYKSVIQFMLLTEEHFSNDFVVRYFDIQNNKKQDENLVLTLLHLKEQFNDGFFEWEKEEIKKHFLAKLNCKVIDSHVHKWRYSEVINSICPSLQMRFKERKIFLCGDYFSNGLGAINSILSAMNLIQQIKN